MASTTKSGRQVKAPVKFDPAGSNPPPAAAPRPKSTRCLSNPILVAEHTFLASFYQEIAAASSNPGTLVDSNVRTTIRRARLARFLGGCTSNRKTIYKRHLRNWNPPPLPVPAVVNGASTAARTAQQDVHRDRTLELDRLNALSTVVHAVIISICACSSTFRAAVRLPDAPNTLLPWNRIANMIRDNAHSIELFARIRGLIFRRLLDADDTHYENLLNKVFGGDRPRSVLLNMHKSLIGSQFGKIFTELQTRHVLRPIVGTWHPHEWCLALSTTPASARRCMIRYLVSAKLKAAQPGSNMVGLPEIVTQDDIAEAITLPDYNWPRRIDWPAQNDDPRYCGQECDPCERCGVIQSVCAAMPVGASQTVARSCACTYGDLQADRQHPEIPLLELITTPRTGKGVRTLERIEEQQYLSPYIGEMYPSRVTRVQQPRHLPRYGGAEGESYLYNCRVQPRHLGRLRSGQAGADGERHDPRLQSGEFAEFYIDPAVRGNWTRYINHSCTPNACFSSVNLGQRLTCLIQATQQICFGEQITVDYGDDYFNGSFGCKCGTAKCKKWDAANPKGRETLKDAKARGGAPAWAQNDPMVAV